MTGAERQARYRRRQILKDIRIGLHFRLLRLEIAARPLSLEQRKSLNSRQKAALRSRRHRAKDELARLKKTARHLTNDLLGLPDARSDSEGRYEA